MRAKTSKVLLILLLSEGGEDDVDVVVDDALFFILGILSLYLSSSISKSVSRPQLSISISTVLLTRKKLLGS